MFLKSLPSGNDHHPRPSAQGPSHSAHSHFLAGAGLANSKDFENIRPLRKDNTDRSGQHGVSHFM